MRHAIANADVGDEQLGEDPAVRALEERTATLLGKEAAVFLPSGTLANIISLFVHCSAGDEVILHHLSHPVYSENAGPAVHSRVALLQLDGPDGTFSPTDIVAAVRPPGVQKPRSRLVAVEDTNNRAGGTVWPVDRLDDVAAAAHAHGLATHLDGARLLNASIASGIAPARLAAGFDSVWIDLSKGLGCPAGAVLTGAAPFIEEARWAKHLFGGALRQAGVLAAAGLYALDHHVDRLADDHALACELAERLTALPGVELAQSRVDTNIVQLDLATAGINAQDLLDRLTDAGILLGRLEGHVLRAVTHLDVHAGEVQRAVDTFAQILADLQRSGSRTS
jgi:threonine aldolase